MIPAGLPVPLEAFCVEMQMDALKIQASDKFLPTCGAGLIGDSRTRVKMLGGNYVYVAEGDKVPKVVVSSPDKTIVMERIFYEATFRMAMSSPALIAFAHPDGRAMSKDEETRLYTIIFSSQEAMLQKIEPSWADHAARKHADALLGLQKGQMPDE